MRLKFANRCLKRVSHVKGGNGVLTLTTSLESYEAGCAWFTGLFFTGNINANKAGVIKRKNIYLGESYSLVCRFTDHVCLNHRQFMLSQIGC